jgi:hypothetical protein
VSGWHRHPPVPSPRAVPTKTWPRAACSGWSPSMTVYTILGMAVHRCGHRCPCPVPPLFSLEMGSLSWVRRCTAPFFQRGSVSGTWLGWSPLPLEQCHHHAVFGDQQLVSSHWEVTIGASPPQGRCATAVSGAPEQTAPRGTMALFAYVAINRGCGRPWPLSWHLLHLCTPFGSWAIHSTHLFTWFHYLEWDWRSSSALHWVASSCGTTWKLWASCELVTLGVCRHLDVPVIGGSLSGVGDCLRPRSIACEGSCVLPCGAPKATLVNCSCHWDTSLVGRFLRCHLLVRFMQHLLATEPPSVGRHNGD